jgi:hypothetical protein
MTNREWLATLPIDNLSRLPDYEPHRSDYDWTCPSLIYKHLFNQGCIELFCEDLDCTDCKPLWLDRECLWPEAT